MDERFRNLFAKHLFDLLNISKCKDPGAAIITRGEHIIASGWSKEVIPGLYVPPIFNAVHMYCMSSYYPSGRWFQHLDSVLFSSYFPKLEEFLLLMTVDVRSVYYMGDIDDEKTVKFLNHLTAKDPDNGFEIIKLEIR